MQSELFHQKAADPKYGQRGSKKSTYVDRAKEMIGARNNSPNNIGYVAARECKNKNYFFQN